MAAAAAIDTQPVGGMQRIAVEDISNDVKLSSRSQQASVGENAGL
jgi:hypothetical protein